MVPNAGPKAKGCRHLTAPPSRTRGASQANILGKQPRPGVRPDWRAILANPRGMFGHRLAVAAAGVAMPGGGTGGAGAVVAAGTSKGRIWTEAVQAAG